MTANVVIRAYDPETHRGMLYTSWLHSARKQHWAAQLAEMDYTATQRSAVDLIMGRKPHILVASVPDLSADIGWMCYEFTENRTILHYVWVRSGYRRTGVADLLTHCLPADEPIVASHLPPLGMAQAPKVQKLVGAARRPYIRYSPALIFDPATPIA